VRARLIVVCRIGAKNSAQVRLAEDQLRAIAEFARSPNGGLIVTVGGTAYHRDLIIALAAKHRLPAVYPYRYNFLVGGIRRGNKKFHRDSGLKDPIMDLR
jgi:hypothetical protein